MDLIERLRNGGHVVPMNSLHSFYLEKCYQHAAKESPDLSTKNGGLLIDDTGKILAYGANKFPEGLEVTQERLTTRPDKYYYTEHAETDTLINAVLEAGVTDFRDKTLYASWDACHGCGLKLTSFKLGRMIGHLSPLIWDRDRAIDEGNIDWGESIEIALNMFDERGMEYFYVEGPLLNPVENLHGGKVYTA